MYAIRSYYAAAAGGTVAVGASFVVDIVNDTTASKLSRSVKAKNVTVTATAKSSVKATAKAGANGAASQSTSTTGDTSGDATDGDEDAGESDRQADKNVSSASKLSRNNFV